MTDKKVPKVRQCDNCGHTPLRRSARAGRMETYKGFEIELPADIELTECDACGERYDASEDILNIDSFLKDKYYAIMVIARVMNLDQHATHSLTKVPDFFARFEEGVRDAAERLRWAQSIATAPSQTPFDILEINTLIQECWDNKSNILDTIKAVRNQHGITLGMAKDFVMRHPAYTVKATAAKEFHEKLHKDNE